MIKIYFINIFLSFQVSDFLATLFYKFFFIINKRIKELINSNIKTFSKTFQILRLK